MSDGFDPRQRAATARRARARRIQAVRMRVAAMAVALFVAAWSGIFVQLVSGDDPALAKDLAPVATQSADPQPTSSDWSADGAPSASDGSTAARAAAPATVTTAQS
ncbi:MAG: hypothetical protein QOJ63_3406 [Solirubrobacteraceae bacterium]|jgi:hypothetical protein|nr:hypothetical protein [Solirubrobacteraceae bacterium]